MVPDVKFEQILIAEAIDSDGIVNGQILTSDAQNITKLELGSSSYDQGKIQDLKGIEAFVNLENLEGQFNGVNNTMNLSTLTKLKVLNFPSNAIT